MLRKATIALSTILGIASGCALLVGVGGARTFEFSPDPLVRYRIAISGGWLSVAGVRLTPASSDPRPFITDAVYRDGTYYGSRGRQSLSVALEEFLRLEANSLEATSPDLESLKLFLDGTPVVGASLLVPEVYSPDLGDGGTLEFLFAVRLPLWMPMVAFLIYPAAAFLRLSVR